jgi:hypothetical protein
LNLGCGMKLPSRFLINFTASGLTLKPNGHTMI